MEQWHQKLHNNSSPDDVVICEALLAYIRSGLDEPAYWDALAAGGVTAARLASFDRPITHAPSFTPGVCVCVRVPLAYFTKAEAHITACPLLYQSMSIAPTKVPLRKSVWLCPPHTPPTTSKLPSKHTTTPSPTHPPTQQRKRRCWRPTWLPTWTRWWRCTGALTSRARGRRCWGTHGGPSRVGVTVGVGVGVGVCAEAALECGGRYHCFAAASVLLFINT